jgi:hypothetical protein
VLVSDLRAKTFEYPHKTAAFTVTARLVSGFPAYARKMCITAALRKQPDVSPH